ncbi:MAG: carbon storage regulator [Planctomycetes bacterium]|nr:carbon storage regulator [Planctomycetota bacterium]
MLVLTRKPRQKILIGGDISITVVAINGQQVRLGITAPARVRILRGEVPREGAQAREDLAAADGPPAPHPQPTRAGSRLVKNSRPQLR